MKFLPLLIAPFFTMAVFAQQNDAAEVTPAIEKRIKQEIEVSAATLKQKLAGLKESALNIELKLDTLRVEEYMRKYIAYDYSTAGMCNAAYAGAKQYDSLLNKYYKKLLGRLEKEDKAVLIQAQKAWILFRNSEGKLIDTMSKELYSGGGTVQQLTNASLYLEMVKNRMLEIFDHYTRGSEDD